MRLKRLLAALTAASLVLSLAGAASAAGPKGKAGEPVSRSDNLSHPLGEAQGEQRAQALEKVLKGQAKATGKNKVVKVAKGQYVELARAGED